MEPQSGTSFGKSHLALIGVSILLLVVATYMRGGLKLGNFGAQSAKSADKPMTLAEAQAKAHQEVEAEYAGAEESAADAATKSKEQLAEVNPQLNGEVLGASVTADGQLDVDQLMNSDALRLTNVNTYQTDDVLKFNAYASQVHAVENQYGGEYLLGALSTRDTGTLQKASAAYRAILAGLQNIQVPSQFEQYHRMKMVYYAATAAMADSMASDGPNQEAATAANLFFTLNDKIDALGSQLESQYGVIL